MLHRLTTEQYSMAQTAAAPPSELVALAAAMLRLLERSELRRNLTNQNRPVRRSVQWAE